MFFKRYVRRSSEISGDEMINPDDSITDETVCAAETDPLGI